MKITILPFFLAFVQSIPGASLPPAQETEQWEPVPPVVSAPAGQVPSDAIILFDGTNLDSWEPVTPGSTGWMIVDGALQVVTGSGHLDTKRSFGDIQLHLEFRTPPVVEGSVQRRGGRGNSGIFFMGHYELQVLDSYNNLTYVNGLAGSIYKQHPPLVNASRPPQEWQTYDVVFIAPRFGDDGTLLSPARMSVFHNGVLVQYDAVLSGRTVNRGEPVYSPHPGKLPLRLQEHRDTVEFRNIWVRELSLATTPRQ